MISSKMLRNAAAAALVTLVGTGPAYALIEISRNGVVTNPVVIAKETITTAAVRTVGTEMHVGFVGAAADLTSALAIRTPIGINVPVGTTLTVRYNLDGLAFGFGGLTAASLAVVRTDGSTIVPQGTGANNVSIRLRSGGIEGDTEAAFDITPGSGLTTAYDPDTPTTATGEITQQQYLVLQLQYLAFPSRDADQSGGVTVVTNQDGTTISASVTGRNILRTVTGIDDDVTSQNHTASVSDGFLKFVDISTVSNDAKTAQFGQIDLGVATVSGATPGSTLALRNRGTGVIGNNVAGRMALSTARVGFSGALTFVEEAYLSDAGCNTSGSFDLLDEDGAWKTGDDRATITQAFDKYLCIEVDGETQITQTEYMATIDNTKITDGLFSVPDLVNQSLGGISLGGSSVHIPFLTTYSGHNHRVLLTNPGPLPVSYTVMFPAGAGATPLARATGMVPANTTITIPVREIVELSEGSRTSATVTAVGVIDVATVLVNRGDGNTDTVLYDRGQ